MWRCFAMNGLLKEHKLKNTKKRQAVIRILEETSTSLPIEHIHDLAKTSIPMNLSTVYRTITVLCDHNIVIKTTNQDGKSYYQLNHHRHEHYLICKHCQTIIAIEECPLHTLEEKLEQLTGFQIMDHRLEFIGICPSCQAMTQK